MYCHLAVVSCNKQNKTEVKISVKCIFLCESTMEKFSYVSERDNLTHFYVGNNLSIYYSLSYR